MLIYIIEDDPDWQQLYRTLLSEHDLMLFSDGVSAMDAIDEQTPGAIILDMLLAGPSAPSLLAELQSYPDLSHIPIALVTSLNVTTDMTPYGVTKVFNKATMNPQELLAWISKQVP